MADHSDIQKLCERMIAEADAVLATDTIARACWEDQRKLARAYLELRSQLESITIGKLDPFNRPESRLHRALSFARQHGYHETDAAFGELHGIRAEVEKLRVENGYLSGHLERESESAKTLYEQTQRDLRGKEEARTLIVKLREKAALVTDENADILGDLLDVARHSSAIGDQEDQIIAAADDVIRAIHDAAGKERAGG